MCDCMIKAVGRLTNLPDNVVAEALKFDGFNPPSIHHVIDYLMGDCVGLVPISREPASLHMGMTKPAMSKEEGEKRFLEYLNNFDGLALGYVGNIGHAEYFYFGTLFSPNGQEHKLDDGEFRVITLMVAVECSS